MAADAAKSAKERAISWNKGDNIKLFELFNKDIANPSATDKHYLEDICEKYFTHILYRNFRTNYLKSLPCASLTVWRMEQAVLVSVTTAHIICCACGNHFC